MVVLAAFTHGTARVAALGFGHTVAYGLGACILGLGVTRRLRQGIVPRHLVVVTVVSVMLAGLAWLAMRALAPDTRALTFAALAGVGLVGLVVYGWFARRWLQPASGLAVQP
jgi:hypothetical protein